MEKDKEEADGEENTRTHTRAHAGIILITQPWKMCFVA